jgi:hypothetical protein
MIKKYIYIAIFFFSLSSCAQNKVTLYSKEHKIAPIINIPLSADMLLNKAAEEFNSNFKKITGEALKIERSDGLNDNYNYIVLRTNPTQNKSFCVYKKGRNITIQGTTNQNLIFGINDFFKNYTPLNFEIKSGNNIDDVIINDIEIPSEFSTCSSPDFEYREPYFSTNFEPQFRNWNKTNYLELEWGIWGHNLPKILKTYNLPQSAYAKVGRNRVESQFCFTSDSLFKYVNKKVKLTFDSDHSLNKYMILPNDNSIVCTCSTCKAVGNTNTDAAPAVFTFLNKLAKDNKDLSFFTTAYITVKNVPRFKAASNVGIFYSTIDIQKGIPIEDSKYFRKFENDLNKWNKYLDNIYIWDYTVNFDNYFDIYPSLGVAQKNLNLYKKLGVTGVFMHGSEYNYSTFQGLKSTILSKLLWSTDIDIDEEIKKYFDLKFPKKLAGELANYYSFIDKSFSVSKKELSIYSGIDKSVKKYLDPKLFFDFYNDFEKHTEQNKYDKEFLKIATALTFLKLEIMRDYGYGEFGFATLNNNEEIIVKNEVGALLDKLNAYSRSSKIETYNEIKYSIKDYIDSWRKTIYKKHKRKHYFFKKPFDVLSKMDEDYQNSKILNDGAFGLKDYNTNWHIVSIDDLVLKIEKKHIKKSKQITLNFLQDVKHSIYYPSSIEILDDNNNLIKKLKISDDRSKLDTKEVTIDLPNEYGKGELPDTFILKINRHIITGKNSLACDEIIFN